jgi:hypothetical protein
MAYLEPRRQIFQEFEQAQAQGALPLYAACVGPLYSLHRPDVDDERAELGDYLDTESSTVYNWPDTVPGGVVDLDDASVLLEDTLLKYYGDSSNASLTETAGNKITSDSLVFKTGNDTNRSTVFGDRDVQVGDFARLRWFPEVEGASSAYDGGAQQELLTQVSGFVAEEVAGSVVPVEDPYRDNGFAYTSLSITNTVVPTTTVPTKYTFAADATAYNGLVDGYPRDIYTIRVLNVGTGGTGGLDGTTLRISSQGGDTTTDITLGTDVIYNGSEYDTALGSRGATFTIEDSGAGSVSLNDSWQVEIAQSYLQVDVADTADLEVTATPSYSGSTNTKYIITVTQGGTLDPASATAGDVTISYISSNGADIAGTLTVPASDFAIDTSVSYPIGSNNVELVFKKGTQFNTAGVFSFSMAAASEGPIRTLILRDPIDHVISGDIDLELFDKVDVDFPSTYSTLTEDTITINGSAQVTSDILGTDALYSVIGGTLVVDFRELRTDICGQVGFADSDSQRESLLGPASPKNPLSKAVFHAIQEGQLGVYFVPVCSDDLAGYNEALDVLTENDEVYSIVPLTNDPDIHQAVKTHVLDRSSPVNNQWRIAWVPNTVSQITDVYTERANEDDIEATVGLFPVNTYREVNAVGALFETNDVRPGDIMRINFSTDAEGVTTYDEYTVDRVNSESQLILVEDVGSPIAVALKIEIWRNQSAAEYAAALAARAAQFDTRRVTLVYIDNPVEADGSTSEIFYAAAALAGQRSGIPPHAPQSQLNLSSVLSDPSVKFSRADLNTIGGGGVWIVQKDFSGRIFTRHQLTSVIDYANFNERESSKTTNLDHISRDFFDATSDLFGQGNISPAMLELLSARLSATISSITNRTYSNKLGPQMLNATVTKLERNAVLRDTIDVEIDPDMPDPLNNLPITFRVS